MKKAALEKALEQMNELSNEVKALRRKVDTLSHAAAKEKPQAGLSARKAWAAHEEDSPVK